METVQDDEYKTLEVTREQAKKMDEEDDDFIRVQYVSAPPRDAEGNLIKTDS